MSFFKRSSSSTHEGDEDRPSVRTLKRLSRPPSPSDASSPIYRDCPTPYPRRHSNAEPSLDQESRYRRRGSEGQQVNAPPDSSGSVGRASSVSRPSLNRAFTLDSSGKTKGRRDSIMSSWVRENRKHADSIQPSRYYSLGQRDERTPLGYFAKRPSMSRATSRSSFASDDTAFHGIGKSMADEDSIKPPLKFDTGTKYKDRLSILRQRNREVIENNDEEAERKEFLLWLAKALLTFGAPSHRIESQLDSVTEILRLNVGFAHLPNLVIVTFLDSGTHTYQTRFVRASGRVALTALHRVHSIYRDVCRDKIRAKLGTKRLRDVLRSPPLYPTWMRCIFAFICASIICTTAFGGTIPDMFIAGGSASTLQYLGLRAAAKSPVYASVYEISVAIIVSFLARALGTLRSNIFCYNAISSAGVVLILPGFTVLISALELTSRNIFCGAVRMVYAIIYTLFLGFGLMIGSDLYLMLNKHARRNMTLNQLSEADVYHGALLMANPQSQLPPAEGVFALMDTIGSETHMIKGCYRNSSWPWYRQPFPWWALLFLVPIYSFCSSLANLQAIRSIQLPIMILFSCLAYAANKATQMFLTTRGDIVSAIGATVIGLCGNIYSRLIGGTAFTAMVTGVLFLVPSAIGSGGGLISTYSTSSQEYAGGFTLGIRMVEVAAGVTIGLFIAQIIVYALGRRKAAAHFAF